jgi:hypothetical protein
MASHTRWDLNVTLGEDGTSVRWHATGGVAGAHHPWMWMLTNHHDVVAHRLFPAHLHVDPSPKLERS